MQIDFHHGVTYVCARLSGFSREEAGIIAHSAQYVDDATRAGEIYFDNGMIYTRIASAHKMLDYKNFSALANDRAWLPFHFLPGNDGEAAPAAHTALDREEYLRRCICRPNSPVAQDLARLVVERQNRAYALYRLGIAMHVYVDTWAHQGFVGFQHPVNVATNLEAEHEHDTKRLRLRIIDFFQDEIDQLASKWVGSSLPLGHGAVLSYPDRPYLKWSYTNGHGERVLRDNPRDFVDAAQQMFQVFCRYREFPSVGNAVFDKTYPLPEAFARVADVLTVTLDENGELRHQAWLAHIAQGTFGFADEVRYIAKGEGSWKHEALGTAVDVDERHGRIPYHPRFQTSHWKLFHDALQAHQFYVLHELLPRYGLLGG
ncbi:MAG TPA: DUF6765 family protein [Noviherbaspirillum sp.]|uniref:DUF6765 family protein n=1 Tax=Noviherbaspirillum sp. TaxID=1926288 RepID=UPI002D2EB334|nr:DUF6765 family protein [Noviherbaspirillum sp.]HYD94948.1 DUF6765 family protein [Noviherbaspirillum sp.]